MQLRTEAALLSTFAVLTGVALLRSPNTLEACTAEMHRHFLAELCVLQSDLSTSPLCLRAYKWHQMTNL